MSATFGSVRGSSAGQTNGLPQAVPDFQVEVIEMILAEGNTIVVQTVMGGPIPADAPGIAKKGQVVSIPCLHPALR
jgi:hypothetical protein